MRSRRPPGPAPTFFAATSRPARDFAAPDPEGPPPGTTPRETALQGLSLDEIGETRLDLICVPPVLHVLEYARVYHLAEACRQASPTLRIRLWLRSPLRDRSVFEALPVDEVHVVESSFEDPLEGQPSSGTRVGLIGGSGAQAAALRSALGERFAGEWPLGFESWPLATAGRAAACEDFFAALLRETPRWRGAGLRIAELPPRPRFLLHQPRAHVGDALWLMPLLREIQRRFEGARVTVVGSQRAGRVLASHPRVEAFWRCDPGASAQVRRGVARQVAAGDFDAALFAFGRHPASSWLVAEAARAAIPWRVNLEYFDPDLDSRQVGADLTHEAWFFWGTMASPRLLLHALDPFLDPGEESGSSRVDYPVSTAALRRAAAILEEIGIGEDPFVLLTPGGDSSTRWPAARFGALAHRLAEDLGVHVLVEGSWEDRELTEAVIGSAGELGPLPPGAPRPVARQDGLPELAALLSRSRLLISNDSAPIHLAEATGTPVLYLAQQEKLVHSHPRGEACWALYDDLENDPAAITVEQVWQAILAMIESRAVTVRGRAAGAAPAAPGSAGGAPRSSAAQSLRGKP